MPEKKDFEENQNSMQAEAAEAAPRTNAFETAYLGIAEREATIRSAITSVITIPLRQYKANHRGYIQGTDPSDYSEDKSIEAMLANLAILAYEDVPDSVPERLRTAAKTFFGRLNQIHQEREELILKNSDAYIRMKMRDFDAYVYSDEDFKKVYDQLIRDEYAARQTIEQSRSDPASAGETSNRQYLDLRIIQAKQELLREKNPAEFVTYRNNEHSETKWGLQFLELSKQLDDLKKITVKEEDEPNEYKFFANSLKNVSDDRIFVQVERSVSRYADMMRPGAAGQQEQEAEPQTEKIFLTAEDEANLRGELKALSDRLGTMRKFFGDDTDEFKEFRDALVDAGNNGDLAVLRTKAAAYAAKKREGGGPVSGTGKDRLDIADQVAYWFEYVDQRQQYYKHLDDQVDQKRLEIADKAKAQVEEMNRDEIYPLMRQNARLQEIQIMPEIVAGIDVLAAYNAPETDEVVQTEAQKDIAKASEEKAPDKAENEPVAEAAGAAQQQPAPAEPEVVQQEEPVDLTPGHHRLLTDQMKEAQQYKDSLDGIRAEMRGRNRRSDPLYVDMSEMLLDMHVIDPETKLPVTATMVLTQVSELSSQMDLLQERLGRFLGKKADNPDGEEIQKAQAELVKDLRSFSKNAQAMSDRLQLPSDLSEADFTAHALMDCKAYFDACGKLSAAVLSPDPKDLQDAQEREFLESLKKGFAQPGAEGKEPEQKNDVPEFEIPSFEQPTSVEDPLEIMEERAWEKLQQPSEQFMDTVLEAATDLLTVAIARGRNNVSKGDADVDPEKIRDELTTFPVVRELCQDQEAFRNKLLEIRSSANDDPTAVMSWLKNAYKEQKLDLIERIKQYRDIMDTPDIPNEDEVQKGPKDAAMQKMDAGMQAARVDASFLADMNTAGINFAQAYQPVFQVVRYFVKEGEYPHDGKLMAETSMQTLKDANAAEGEAKEKGIERFKNEVRYISNVGVDYLNRHAKDFDAMLTGKMNEPDSLQLEDVSTINLFLKAYGGMYGNVLKNGAEQNAPVNDPAGKPLDPDAAKHIKSILEKAPEMSERVDTLYQTMKARSEIEKSQADLDKKFSDNLARQGMNMKPADRKMFGFVRECYNTSAQNGRAVTDQMMRRANGKAGNLQNEMKRINQLGASYLRNHIDEFAAIAHPKNDAELVGNWSKLSLAADCYKNLYRDQKSFLNLAPEKQRQVMDIMKQKYALEDKVNAIAKGQALSKENKFDVKAAEQNKQKQSQL